MLADNTTEFYICQQCESNCLLCDIKTSSEGVTTLPCKQCIFGYTTMEDGSCFPCGSTAATYGCQTCNSDKSCKTCLPGLELDDKGLCKAKQLTNKSPAGFFIVVIVVLSVACAGLIGLAIYWQCSKKPESSLYSQIAWSYSEYYNYITILLTKWPDF